MSPTRQRPCDMFNQRNYTQKMIKLLLTDPLNHVRDNKETKVNINHLCIIRSPTYDAPTLVVELIIYLSI